MILRLLLISIAALAITMGGCKKEPAEPVEVEVTAENLDTELDKMEAQIEADIAVEE